MGFVMKNGGSELVSYSGKEKEIVIPDRVTSIGAEAFLGCESLTSITIPSSVINIGERAFSGCKALKDIIIFGKTATIKGGTFRGCTSLTNIILPDGVEIIEDWAFRDCKALFSITIPQSIKRIDSKAFFGCTSLNAVIYNGTREQWEEVEQSLEAIVICSDEEHPSFYSKTINEITFTMTDNDELYVDGVG